MGEEEIYRVNKMQRSIPGAQEVKGREFMYIESAIDETFQQLLNSVSSLCPTMAIPRSGGAIEEKVRIKLQDGTALMGISYKGDVEGWRARFVGFCEVTARKYGFIKEGRLFLSNDSSLSLKELEFNFEQ